MASDAGYINYFEILGLENGANPGEVRNAYKRTMKKLMQELSSGGVAPEKQNQFLLDMARLNASVYVLKDKDRREAYIAERDELIALEETWCASDQSDYEQNNKYRAEFDTKVRSFLSKYVEATTLTAGQDKEVAEASHWDVGHSRAATSLLRYYRHHLYNEILDRLPYHEVTAPNIDWDERKSTIAAMLKG